MSGARELDPRADALHEPQPFARRDEALRAQRAEPAQPREHVVAGEARRQHELLRGEALVAVRRRAHATRRAPLRAHLREVGREQQLGRHLRVHGPEERRFGLPLAQLALEPGQRRGGHAVDLVQQQEVGRRDLLREGVVEVAPVGELLRVHHHHRHVVGDPVAHRVAPELELGLERQRDARGLDHDPVGLRALAQRLERLDERVGELAAHAAAARARRSRRAPRRAAPRRCRARRTRSRSPRRARRCGARRRAGGARAWSCRCRGSPRRPATGIAGCHAASSNGSSSGSGTARSSAYTPK